MDIRALTLLLAAITTYYTRGNSFTINRTKYVQNGRKSPKSRRVMSRPFSHRKVDLQFPYQSRNKLQNLSLSHPTLIERALICSKTGYLLQIPFSGKIRGSLDRDSKFVRILIEVVDTSVVRLKGEHSQNYLAMNRNGNLYLSKTANNECLFKETMERTDFHTFASYPYSGKNTMNISGDWYLAIKRNGKIRHATNTSKRQKATQFMVVRRSR